MPIKKIFSQAEKCLGFLIILPMLMLSNSQGSNASSGNEQYKKYEKAIFAGGCFWCMEADFEKTPGILEVVSGYTGGHTDNPAYKEVSSGRTGHVEAIEVIYDPARITYQELLDVFWKAIDPTDPDGQFVDRGTQYKSAIFYLNNEQKKLSEKSKETQEKSGRFKKPIVTEIVPASNFYDAEEYHQGYY